MTIRRLSVYTRCLLQLEEDGVKTISSQELAERFSLNSAQVRKDLAYFGEFGVRGIGYYVSGLKAELQRILGLDREWPVALVGFGNLGSALFHYKGFARQGFRIAAIFDDDPAKVGQRGRRRADLAAAAICPREAKARNLQLAIVAVPAESAQAVTDKLVGRRHQGGAQLRARPDQRAEGRPPQERRPVDRARDAELLPRPGRRGPDFQPEPLALRRGSVDPGVAQQPFMSVTASESTCPGGPRLESCRSALARGVPCLQADGLWGSARALVAAALVSETGRPALLLAPGTAERHRMAEDARFFLGSLRGARAPRPVLEFPPAEPASWRGRHREHEAERALVPATVS